MKAKEEAILWLNRSQSSNCYGDLTVVQKALDIAIKQTEQDCLKKMGKLTQEQIKRIIDEERDKILKKINCLLGEDEDI